MDHNEDLRYIREVMADVKRYDHAARLIEFDQNTACPEDGLEEEGETMVCLRAHIYKRMHEEAFVQAVENTYERRDSLDVRDRRMIEWLYRDRCRTADFSSDQEKENKRIKNRAYLSWISSRESNDCRQYLRSVAEVVETEKNRVSLWRGDELPESLYDRMLDENERGMRMSILDPLFENCGREAVSLLRDIQKSRKVIRTDFLSRKVSEEQQKKICGFLMDTIGFDRKRGMLAMSESVFTDGIAPDDVRMTTCFYERNFLANVMSVMHEGGHALFEQMLPREDHEHFINRQMTQGMHESVSRFYENIIGRSRAFIHYVYPKFCEIMPQVFCDVTEQELYEAVNAVEPSLIRTDADELTYILHIIIRYEIEKDLVEGGLRAEDLADAWRDRYMHYLGIVPEDDLTGVLQDPHWVDGFGYFPDYALGNFYGAAYYRRMQESFDVEEAVSGGHIDRINRWMKDNVFAGADLLDPSDWIKDITGEELSFRPFIEYLRRKYEDIYDLPGSLSAEADEYRRQA